MAVCIYRQDGDSMKRTKLDGLQNRIFNRDSENQIHNEQLEYEQFKKSNSSALSFIEWKRIKK